MELGIWLHGAGGMVAWSWGYDYMELEVWLHGAGGMVAWSWGYGCMELEVWLHGAGGMVAWSWGYGCMELEVWLHGAGGYFCEQKDDLEIQDVLLHAVYSANYSKNKMELLIAIVFYAKHKDKMDILQLRKKATKLGYQKFG